MCVSHWRQATVQKHGESEPIYANLCNMGWELIGQSGSETAQAEDTELGKQKRTKHRTCDQIERQTTTCDRSTKIERWTTIKNNETKD